MGINLKNYSTEVSASRSIELLENLLVEFGAKNLMKEYDNGRCSSVSFIIEVENMKLPFRLAPKVKECYVWLKKKKPKGKDSALLQQAERIVWKQLYELTYLQLCQVELDQLEKLEAFFPFLYDVGKGLTYYQQLKQGQFKGLLPAPN